MDPNIMAPKEATIGIVDDPPNGPDVDVHLGEVEFMFCGRMYPL